MHALIVQSGWWTGPVQLHQCCSGHHAWITIFMWANVASQYPYCIAAFSSSAPTDHIMHAWDCIRFVFWPRLWVWFWCTCGWGNRSADKPPWGVKSSVLGVDMRCKAADRPGGEMIVRWGVWFGFLLLTCPAWSCLAPWECGTRQRCCLGGLQVLILSFVPNKGRSIIVIRLVAEGYVPQGIWHDCEQS